MTSGAWIPQCPVCGAPMTPVLNDEAAHVATSDGPLPADPPFRYLCHNSGCDGSAAP